MACHAQIRPDTAAPAPEVETCPDCVRAHFRENATCDPVVAVSDCGPCVEHHGANCERVG